MFGHIVFANLIAQETLYLAKLGLLGRPYESHSLAPLSGTRCSAYAVDIIFGLARHLIVDA